MNTIWGLCVKIELKFESILEDHMCEYLLKTNNLSKQYKKRKAVVNVSIHIKKGSIYGLIGRNGAGKTTFLKLISGLSQPTSGEIDLFGYKGKETRIVFERVGALIEEPGLYPNLTAFDNLKLKALCIGLYKKNYIEELLEIVGLENTGNKTVKKFSLGMKQRLGIALALIGEPDLLVLDEPINGLDPQGIIDIRNTIIKLNKERDITVILSSHILEELTKVATHYGIIDHGKLIEELTKEELAKKCCERIEIILEEPDRACTVLDNLKIYNYKVVSKDKICIYERLEQVADINMELSFNKIKVRSIGVMKDNLEKYFMDLTGG